ncbi:hypothetical protein FOL47_010466 [Perkinsus chesapeaki]|uniref:Non-specific serine/threonine protein kinase n=1 Tax=Perkinsus chesapeaki TaxID=330153 RepID=A0A7J6MQF2_PERCH|nr:hypothetical protein FOL47_010466 [Perkinsus chesapeaki]
MLYRGSTSVHQRPDYGDSYGRPSRRFGGGGGRPAATGHGKGGKGYVGDGRPGSGDHELTTATNDNLEGHYLACIAAFKNQDPVAISAAVDWLNDRGSGKVGTVAAPLLSTGGLSFLSVHSPHEAMSLLTYGIMIGENQPGCRWAATWALDAVGPYYNSLWQPLDRQRSSERQETVWGFIDCRLKKDEFGTSEGSAVVDLAVTIAQYLDLCRKRHQIPSQADDVGMYFVSQRLYRRVWAILQGESSMSNGAVRTAMKVLKAFSLSTKGIKTIGASVDSLVRMLVEWTMHASAHKDDLELAVSILQNLRPALGSSSLMDIVSKYTDDLSKAMAEREGFDPENPLEGNYRHHQQFSKAYRLSRLLAVLTPPRGLDQLLAVSPLSAYGWVHLSAMQIKQWQPASAQHLEATVSAFLLACKQLGVASKDGDIDGIHASMNVCLEVATAIGEMRARMKEKQSQHNQPWVTHMVSVFLQAVAAIDPNLLVAPDIYLARARVLRELNADGGKSALVRGKFGPEEKALFGMHLTQADAKVVANKSTSTSPPALVPAISSQAVDWIFRGLLPKAVMEPYLLLTCVAGRTGVGASMHHSALVKVLQKLDDMRALPEIESLVTSVIRGAGEDFSTWQVGALASLLHGFEVYSVLIFEKFQRDNPVFLLFSRNRQQLELWLARLRTSVVYCMCRTWPDIHGRFADVKSGLVCEGIASSEIDTKADLAELLKCVALQGQPRPSESTIGAIMNLADSKVDGQHLLPGLERSLIKFHVEDRPMSVCGLCESVGLVAFDPECRDLVLGIWMKAAVMCDRVAYWPFEDAMAGGGMLAEQQKAAGLLSTWQQTMTRGIGPGKPIGFADATTSDVEASYAAMLQIGLLPNGPGTREIFEATVGQWENQDEIAMILSDVPPLTISPQNGDLDLYRVDLQRRRNGDDAARELYALTIGEDPTLSVGMTPARLAMFLRLQSDTSVLPLNIVDHAVNTALAFNTIPHSDLVLTELSRHPSMVQRLIHVAASAGVPAPPKSGQTYYRHWLLDLGVRVWATAGSPEAAAEPRRTFAEYLFHQHTLDPTVDEVPDQLCISNYEEYVKTEAFQLYKTPTEKDSILLKLLSLGMDPRLSDELPCSLWIPLAHQIASYLRDHRPRCRTFAQAVWDKLCKEEPLRVIWLALSLAGPVGKTDPPPHLVPDSAILEPLRVYHPDLVAKADSLRHALRVLSWSFEDSAARVAQWAISSADPNKLRAVLLSLGDEDSIAQVFGDECHPDARYTKAAQALQAHIAKKIRDLRRGRCEAVDVCKSIVDWANGSRHSVQVLTKRGASQGSQGIRMVEDLAPGLVSMDLTGLSFEGVPVQRVAAKVQCMTTKSRPKRVAFDSPDGRRFDFLLKGADDVRNDALVMQVIRACGDMLDSEALMCAQRSESEQLFKTYDAIPLAPRCGMVRWVHELTSLIQMAKHQPNFREHDMLEWRRLTFEALKNAGINPSKTPRKHWDQGILLQVWRTLRARRQSETGDGFIRTELVLQAGSPKQLFAAYRRFAASMAINSAASVFAGMGDRHLENISIHRPTGAIVHIDFSVSFHKGRRLKVPERVPMRLTAGLCSVLQSTPGEFRRLMRDLVEKARWNANTRLVDGDDLEERYKYLIPRILGTVLRLPLVEWSAVQLLPSLVSLRPEDRLPKCLSVLVASLKDRASEVGNAALATIAGSELISLTGSELLVAEELIDDLNHRRMLDGGVGLCLLMQAFDKHGWFRNGLAGPEVLLGDLLTTGEGAIKETVCPGAESAGKVVERLQDTTAKFETGPAADNASDAGEIQEWLSKQPPVSSSTSGNRYRSRRSAFAEDRERLRLAGLCFYAKLPNAWQWLGYVSSQVTALNSYRIPASHNEAWNRMLAALGRVESMLYADADLRLSGGLLYPVTYGEKLDHFGFPTLDDYTTDSLFDPSQCIVDSEVEGMFERSCDILTGMVEGTDELADKAMAASSSTRWSREDAKVLSTLSNLHDLMLPSSTPKALAVLHTDVENLSKALGAAAREESERKDASHILARVRHNLVAINRKLDRFVAKAPVVGNSGLWQAIEEAEAETSKTLGLVGNDKTDPLTLEVRLLQFRVNALCGGISPSLEIDRLYALQTLSRFVLIPTLRARLCGAFGFSISAAQRAEPKSARAVREEADASPAEAKAMAKEWAMNEIARRARAVMKVPKDTQRALAELRKVRAEIASVGSETDESLPPPVKEACQSIEDYLYKARQLLPSGSAKALKLSYAPLVASINEVAITVGAADFDHAIVDDCVQLRRLLAKDCEGDDMEIFGRVLGLFGRLGVHIPVKREPKKNDELPEGGTEKTLVPPNSDGGEQGSSAVPGPSAASDDDEVDEDDEIEDDSDIDTMVNAAPAVRTQLAQEASASGTLASPSENSHQSEEAGSEEPPTMIASAALPETDNDDPVAALAMQVAKPVSSQSPLPNSTAVEKSYRHNLVLSRIFDSDLPLRASIRESGSSPPPGLASPSQAAPLVRWEHMAWSGSIALSAARLVPNPADAVGTILSSEAVVNQWISEATDEGSLSRMYEGWTSWI